MSKHMLPVVMSFHSHKQLMRDSDKHDVSTPKPGVVNFLHLRIQVSTNVATIHIHKNMTFHTLCTLCWKRGLFKNHTTRYVSF